MTPNFVIIGAMKCGTSTLHDQLAAQPGFFLTDPKEPNYFSDPEQFARGASWYASLFDGAAEGELRGESSTHYTKLPTYPETVARLAAAVPEVRCVYVMRHPVDRLVSHYIHEWSERTITTTLDQAARDVPRLVEYGCYAMQLAPFLERFGRDRVLPVFFERLMAEPQAEFERIGRFLGHPGPLRWETDREARNVGSQRMRDSAWRDAIVKQPQLAWLRRNLVPKSLRTRVRSLWTMKKRPELSPAIRRELELRFDADLALLGEWLGTPLDCASFRERVLPAPLDWTKPHDA